MRLLSTIGDELVLRTFVSEPHRPAYAILSHTWLADEDEVIYADLQSLDAAKNKPGWLKLHHARRQARENGHLWIWVDTCCIDKSSSAELSEAINSMFRWYRDASLCLVYLDDVPSQNSVENQIDSGVPQILINDWRVADMEEDKDRYAAFSRCRWLTRGWTLQEMLAPEPHLVQFFDAGWNSLGSLADLAPAVARATGIAVSVLKTGPWRKLPRDCSIAQRMSWAAKRQTTRVEDRAYSLLGLFGVNMPILYGEGQKAFFRLQEAIMRDSPDDLTIFFWDRTSSKATDGSARLLAELLEDFEEGADIVNHRQAGVGFELLTHGVRVTLQIKAAYWQRGDLVAVLPCHSEIAGYMFAACLTLRKDKHADHYWVTGRPWIDAYDLLDAKIRTVTIRYLRTSSGQISDETPGQQTVVSKRRSKILLRGTYLTRNSYSYGQGRMSIEQVEPLDAWDSAGAYFNLPNPLRRGEGFRASVKLSFYFANNRETSVQLFLSQANMGQEFFIQYGWTDIVSATMDFCPMNMSLESWKPGGTTIRQPNDKCVRQWDRAPKGCKVEATMVGMAIRGEHVLVVKIETRPTGEMHDDDDDAKQRVNPLTPRHHLV